MKIELLPFSKINPAPYNPRKDLQPGDPEYEKLKRSIQEFGLVDPLIWNKRTGNLVGGHQRLKILQELGHTESHVSVVDLDDQKEKALNIALNKISGDWDYPLLKDLLEDLDTGDMDIEITGFDMAEIEDLMTQFPVEEKKKPTILETEFVIEDDIEREIAAAKKVFIMFSGGRDSSVCSFLMIPMLKEMGKDFELLFVDTGVEIPSVSEYVVRFAEWFDAKLTMVRGGVDFFSHYENKKMWPNAIYRDCIAVLIKTPSERYIATQVQDGESYIVIRGARQDQATDRAQGQKICSIKGTGIGGDVRQVNPLYNLSQEAFDGYEKQLSESFGLWEGYAKGFRRTACWTCPFQTVDQYDTIRKELPFLWEVLRRKAREWDFMGATHIDRYIRVRGL